MERVQRKKRPLTPYVQWMKDEQERLKVADPTLTAKQRFLKSAQNWHHFKQSQKNLENSSLNVTESTLKQVVE